MSILDDFVKNRYFLIGLSSSLSTFSLFIFLVFLQTNHLSGNKPVIPLFPPHPLTNFGIETISPLHQQSGIIISHIDDRITWDGQCIEQRMQVIGAGFSQQPAISNTANVSFISEDADMETVVQVVGRKNKESIYWPDKVVLLTDSTGFLTVTYPLTGSGNAFSFITSLSFINWITATIYENAPVSKAPRDLILYRPINTNGELWTTTGQTMMHYVYGGNSDKTSYTRLFTFIELEAQTDILVTAVINDKNRDGRDLFLTAQSGEISVTQHITYPNQGNRLSIITLTLPGVSTHTNQISVTLKSPTGTGDSAILSGLNISYRCPDSSPEFFTFLPLIKKPAYIYLPYISDPHRPVIPCQTDPENNASREAAKAVGPLKQNTSYCGAYNDNDGTISGIINKYILDNDYMYLAVGPNQVPATLSATIRYDEIIEGEVIPYNHLYLYPSGSETELGECCVHNRRASTLWITATISSPGEYYLLMREADKGGPKPWIKYRIVWTLQPP